VESTWKKKAKGGCSYKMERLIILYSLPAQDSISVIRMEENMGG
jgi:hypothetical protein